MPGVGRALFCWGVGAAGRQLLATGLSEEGMMVGDLRRGWVNILSDSC